MPRLTAHDAVLDAIPAASVPAKRTGHDPRWRPGSLYPAPAERTSFVIFDAVPGGTDSTIRLARSFDEMLDAALTRVARCDRGAETSCNGCLRGYRNQPFHEELRRRTAVDFLRPVVPAGHHSAVMHEA